MAHSRARLKTIAFQSRTAHSRGVSKHTSVMEKELNVNSIDQAIEITKSNITTHRRQSRTFLMLILVLILTFIFTQFYQSLIEQKNIDRTAELIKEISQFKSDINLSFNNYVSANEKLKNIDSEFYRYIKERIAEDSSSIDLHERMINYLNSDSVNVQSTMNKIDRIPEKLSVNSFPEATIYILYGLFILIFGVITSFYRFHLKEISKNEHILIGFYRIRIAGNNSETGYNDYVKYYLSKDAFFSSDKPSPERIESPLPGHPTSDISTTILNKLIEKLDIKDLMKKEKK